MPDDNAAFPVMELTSANAARLTAHYPYAVRQALKLATHIEAGQLDLRLPDGGAFRITGDKPGPQAMMVIRDLDFAGTLSQGEIGISARPVGEP